MHFMGAYEERLSSFLKQNNSSAEILTFDTSCHSVKEAADNLKVDPANLIKSICMIDSNDSLIVAIVRGNDRASSKRISKALSLEKLRVATPEEMLEKTGYPCGGTPPLGYQATFLIDTKVMENNVVYGGGGAEFFLVRIQTNELKKLNNAQIIKISK